MFTSGKKTAMLAFVSSILFLHCSQVVHAAHGGKLYALGFFNLTSGNPSIFGPTSPIFEEIMISCFKCTTQVIVRVPSLNYSNIVSLDSTNGWNKRIQLNQDIATAIQLPAGLTWVNAAVSVVSLNASITVHVNKARPGSTAAYLALPLTYNYNYLTDPPNVIYNYFVSSHTTVGNTVISIVSLFNYTCVQVYKGFAKTLLQDFTLQENQVFNMYATNSDFTGIQITSRKPLGVFTGADNVQIPPGNADYDAIVEQIPKVSLLINTLSAVDGSLIYYHILTSIPGLPYSVGFEYRIIGATTAGNIRNINITEYSYSSAGSAPVLVNYTLIPMLNRTDYLEGTAGRNNSDFTIVIINCRTGCMVSQYLDGNALTGGPSLHPDPAMVIVPPIHRYTKDITFSTSHLSDGNNAIAANNFITIVANSASYQSLQLDGVAVGASPSNWYAVEPVMTAPYSQYYVTTMPVSDGFHTLSTNRDSAAAANDAYNAFVFGFGADSNKPTGYAYMASFNNLISDVDPPTGPWYNLPSTGQPSAGGSGGTNGATDGANGGSGSTSAVANEIRPSYGIIVVANFTAITTSGTISDRTCAALYAEYFKYRINGLNSTIASDPQFLAANSLCGAAGTTVTVSTPSQNAYYSEYSRSAGTFSVNITGTGNATLGNVFNCAKMIGLWIRDPNNWIPDYNRDTANFLRKDNKNYPKYQQLQDGNCDKLYVSNDQGLLSIYSQGWICPFSAIDSVFATSRASSRCQFSLAAAVPLVALLVSALATLMFR